ncbi:hypothetical protein RRG08_005926 [Elysia crispata]|uniref:Uncharacterized protein n=1 Tax=Elysia crispata TaxID=231223 RepID=A0AAE0ZH55_9GAST|nr:hypothetical protein RRG08_005926 [Elysia crispata]
MYSAHFYRISIGYKQYPRAISKNKLNETRKEPKNIWCGRDQTCTYLPPKTLTSKFNEAAGYLSNTLCNCKPLSTI